MDLTRSLVHFPVSATVSGLRRLSGLVTSSFSGRAGGGPALFRRFEQQFGHFVQEAFKLDAHLPEADGADTGDASPNSLMARRLAKAGFDLAEITAGQIGRRLGGQNSAWRELQNKLESFGTFRYADSVLHMGPDDGSDIGSLNDLADRAHALDPYVRVWSMEGLGHITADRAWRRGEVGSLLKCDVTPVVEAGLVALHTGMGLSFGKHLLGTLDADPTEAAADDLITRYAALCEDNSRTGYEGVALEGLGLVAQTLYPRLISPLDRQLGARDSALQALFWHGIGRGRYFTLLSSAASQASDLLAAPHEIGRRNVVSGLAWPLTLVNIRHPEVVASFLERHGRALEVDGAFAAGVCSAIAVWSTATGGDPYVERFPGHAVNERNRALGRRWEEQIRGPWQLALRELGPEARRSHLFGDLFQYPAGSGVAKTGAGQKLASL